MRVELETDYPFRDQYRVKVTAEKPVEFALYLRAPGFVSGAQVDGTEAEPGKEFRMLRRWDGEQEVTVRFSMEPQMSRRPSGMYVLNRGPLLFSLPVAERWQREEFTRNGVERRFPWCDYQIFPESKWNYAFAGQDWEPEFGQIGEYPFSPQSAGISLWGDLAEIQWGMEDGLLEEVPGGEVLAEPQRMRLIPYGCTNLRMTELPLVLEK